MFKWEIQLGQMPKTFKIGNSVAITIPKHKNLKPGVKYSFSKKGKTLVYTPIENKKVSLPERIEKFRNSVKKSPDSVRLIREMRLNE